MEIERRNAERKRRTSDHMFQAIFMAMDEGVVLLGQSGEIVAVNPAAENILGMTATELIGRSTAECVQALNCITEDETPLSPELHPVLLALQEGKPQRNVLLGAHRPDGTLVWLSINAQPMVSAGEAGPRGVVTTFRDVTERKRTEDALSFVAQRGWVGSNENFFDALVQYLGKTLRVEYVLISKLTEAPGIVETVALYAKGAIVPNLRYSLKGTPCENVMGQKFCLYPQGIQQTFPEDALLVEMEASSYAGLPLWDSTGQPLGLIAVLDGKPLRDEAHVSQILQFMATRAAAELERKRNDRMLRRNEREFRSLAENMPDRVIRYDLQTRVQYANPALMTSVAPEFLPVLGESVTQTYPGNEGAAWCEHVVEQVIATGAPAEVEFEMANPQGELRLNHVRYVAERDEHGEIVGALGIGRDITEQRASEQQLRQSLEFTQGVINAIPDLLFEADRDGICLNVWARTPELLAMHKEALLGKRISDVVAPDSAEVALAALREADEKGLSFGKVLRVNIPQGERWFELSVSKKPGGDVPGRFIVLSRDITGRKRMEDDIRRRELEFRILAENMPDNVVRHDRQVRAQYMNPAMIASVAPEALPVLGKSPSESHPGNDAAASHQRMIEQVIATGIPAELEFQFPNPHGEMRVHHLYYVAERDDHGEIVGALGIGRDITERKRMEDDIRRRELEFRSLAENMPDSVIRYDRQARVLYMNPAFMANVAPEILPVLGESLVETYPDRDAAASHQRIVEQVIATGTPAEVEFQLPNPNGEIRIHQARCVAERDGNGEIIGVLGIGRDITERKRMEEDIRRRELEFRSLAENMPDNVVRYDLQARAVYMNPAIMANVAPHFRPVLGEAPMETYPGKEGAAAHQRIVEQVIATGMPAEWEFQTLDSCGEIRIHHARYVAERDNNGETVGVLGIGRDITERKRMEQVVAAREQEFRSLAENSLDSIIRYDRDGRIRYLNSGLLAFFGMSATDIIGRLPREVWPDGRYAEIERASARAAETGEATTVEFDIADAAGVLRSNQVVVVPERDSAGQIIGSLAFGRDVTTLRETERQLRHFIENLPGMAYTFRLSPDGHSHVPYVSPAIKELFGVEPDDVKDDTAPLCELTHPEDRPRIEAATAESARTMTPYRIEYRVCRPDQPERWVDQRCVPEREADGSIIWYGILLDCTERRLAEEYEQFRSRTLELVSGGAPLPVILEGIVRGVEQLKPGMICSILLLDKQGKKLGEGVAPSLPDFYNAAVDGLEIGVGVGCCGTVAATGERVIADDIMTHPYWAHFKELAAKAGLAACWSEPILASSGKVLGTFAVYHRQAHSPAAFDISLIEKSTHLVSIAIERRRAEEALRASELEFRSLAENMPDNVVRYDWQARAQYFNPAMKASLAPGFLPVLGKSPIETFPGNDAVAGYQQAIEQVIATGTHVELEFQAHDPRGEIRDHLVRFVAERDDNGKIVGALAIGQDITERKRAEMYEQFRSRTLELVSGGAPLPVILEGIVRGVEQLKPDMICSIVLLDSQSKRFCKVIGPSLPDSYNAGLDGLEIGIGVGSCGTAAATGERVIVEDIQTHPYWAPYKEIAAGAGLAACWSEPIRASTGQVLGTFAAYHRQAHSPAPFDIALIEKSTHLVSIAIERRRAEEALRASEREFRTLAENLPDPLVRYDREGRRTYVSPVLERAFAITAESMVGMKARENNPTAMPMRETYVRALEHTLATGERSEFEMQMAPPDGNMRTYMCFMVAERALDGQISGAIAVSRDITERKRAELEREAHAHSLECLDRINKALQGTTDLEQMMNDVLDVVLAIFDCDRAFLVYPCDPDATEFRVPMECTKPEYPGALALGRVVPMDKEASKMMRITLGAIGPVKFGPGTEYPLPRYLPEQYGVKSQMLMALHPKLDQPWLFGIHQCSHAKDWTEDESALFQKIGQRLTDALTGLLIYRDLQVSERKFRTLAENLPDFLVRYDREGCRTYINPTMERVFAVGPEQMLGSSLRQDNPAKLPMPQAYLRALEHTLATGERSEFEMQFFPSGGGTRTGLCFMVAERGSDGQITGAIAVSRDITEQKRTEARLAVQARRAEVLLELPDASEAMDEVAFMQRGQELAEELTGSSISFIHFVNEDEDSIDLVTWSRRTLEHYCSASFNKHYPTSEAGIWADALRQRRPVVFNDYAAYPHKRGLPEGHAEVTRLISLPVIENGKVVMLAGVGNKPADYTDLDVETVQLIANEIWHIVQRKRTDKQLEEHRNHLERLVESRTQALSIAKETAEAATQAKSRFLAAASHDLRQPIAAIGLYNDALALSGLNEEQKRMSHNLTRSVNSLGEMLNELLDMAKLDAGKLVLQPTVIQTEELLGTIASEFDSVAREKQLSLNLYCSRRNLALFTDRNLLLTILRNLIGNAVKYTRQGGILVSIRRRGNRALIQVWDTGIGIAPEQLDLIFEEYFQASNSERNRVKGAGLGLAIVKRVSEALGSRVICRSRLGRGSVFEISLPLAQDMGQQAIAVQTCATNVDGVFGRLAGKRIVVIEDDAMAATALKSLLEAHGMQVTHFGTAEDALGSTEAMAADHYISDYHLPGMDGLQLLDAIQTKSAEPIRAVLLTGNTSLDQTQSSRWKVLFKPIALPELLSAMEL